MTQNRIDRLHAKGERFYQRLKPRLEPRHKGEMIAIEVESGGYVMGEDDGVAQRQDPLPPADPLIMIQLL